jgi:uracil-DNA glycosylase
MNTKKILIIGQAPPAVKQAVPYDTTMLYDIFEWIGITKEQAQNMFEFEACIGFFPGFEDSGHKKPTYDEMFFHYDNVNKEKIAKADKVILLGNVSRDFHSQLSMVNPNKFLHLIHPSKRNYHRIMQQKEDIIKALKTFIYENHR